ncbi:MAG: hypothetical protein HOM84_06765 [Thiotrichales bacterium]|jgi:hypothetical protein|nr:hypothetical protein [Thiotrichales bacterium]MBT3614318.1 hypothetical protein [Thiotrichales bacterium]MBT3753296.1 hypothetical protein [Thiotrichales bacterium]MBT3838290.1 hypothetical protein [Thiotrichales bacterium]MBT4152392.1 hypothetical protein [Thiotrichales bacterium]
MKEISNDSEFKKVIDELTLEQQREVGTRFVHNVLQRSENLRVEGIIAAVSAKDQTGNVLSAAYRDARDVSLKAHTRCDSECNWNEQASYFIARAAEACVEPKKRSHGKNPAWKAAMHCRMARTCIVAEQGDESNHSESELQYEILKSYLNLNRVERIEE